MGREDIFVPRKPLITISIDVLVEPTEQFYDMDGLNKEGGRSHLLRAFLGYQGPFMADTKD